MTDADKQKSLHSTPVYRARRVLIVGCGDLGSSLAVMLSDSGSIIRVLDKNDQAFKALRRASAHEADIFIACTGSQTINLMAAQIAKNVIQTSKILCVLRDAEMAEIFEKLDIESVVSRKIMADHLFDKAMA